MGAGKSCYEAYAVKDVTQTKRYSAQKLGSTYAYDYIDLLREVVKRRWEAVQQQFAGAMTTPRDYLKVTELVLDEKDQLVEKPSSDTGDNNVGMIAWKIKMRTPEIPQGRDIILITNDITHVIGSFGPREDMASDSHLDLSRAPYVLYGVKYIDLLSLVAIARA